MKRIYLDVCTLCRPFDDQSYARIRLETDSVNLILSKIKDNNFQLMKSPIHYKEIESIYDDLERIELIKLLDTYGKEIKFNKSILRKRTEEIYELNFGIADAAHVAFAENYHSTFISCDDKLLNKCSKHINKIECINPVIFCEMEKLI
jgi:hypothetical protein